MYQHILMYHEYPILAFLGCSQYIYPNDDLDTMDTEVHIHDIFATYMYLIIIIVHDTFYLFYLPIYLSH